MSINNCLIENSMGSECHNSYDFHDGGILSDNCNIDSKNHNTCASIAVQLLAFRNRYHIAKYPVHKEVVYAVRTTTSMDKYDKHSWETITRIFDTEIIVIMALIGISLAQVACYKWTQADAKVHRLKLYLLEFVLISVLLVVSCNILNPYIVYVIALAALILGIFVRRTKCLKTAAQREFEFGSRPVLLTQLRSTMNILTSVCILAVDFGSFPKKFRKSRRYGAGVMDAGIGMFVIVMAAVSSRPKRLNDLRKSVFTVVCLLVLGLGRTLVIKAIDYNQDEHEYGTHLNAFFTLGLTKLFATLLMFLVKSNKQQLAFGVALLILHEITLQLGLSSFVMDPNLARLNFLTSNREGLCSLPGFIALFLISQCVGQWIRAKNIYTYEEIIGKLKELFYLSVFLWLLVIGSTASLGIARVTCNFGYVIWVLAIFVTNNFLYLFVLDVVLNTVYPVDSKYVIGDFEEANFINKPAVNSAYGRAPYIVEAVNYNVLIYFLISNVLTGMVNIFIATEERTSLESVLILSGYSFITGSFISLLYYFKIRIA